MSNTRNETAFSAQALLEGPARRGANLLRRPLQTTLPVPPVRPASSSRSARSDCPPFERSCGHVTPAGSLLDGPAIQPPVLPAPRYPDGWSARRADKRSAGQAAVPACPDAPFVRRKAG